MFATPDWVLHQWFSYSPLEWLLFIAITFLGVWACGIIGAFLSHCILFFVILHLDVTQILSQPGGDLDLIFHIGFYVRVLSINGLLLFVLVFPMLFVRQHALRINSFWKAVFVFRIFPTKTAEI